MHDKKKMKKICGTDYSISKVTKQIKKIKY